MGDRLGTRVVAGSNARYCRISLGYGCPGCAVWGQAIIARLGALVLQAGPISPRPQMAPAGVLDQMKSTMMGVCPHRRVFKQNDVAVDTPIMWVDSDAARRVRVEYRCAMCPKQCLVPCRLTTADFRLLEQQAVNEETAHDQ